MGQVPTTLRPADNKLASIVSQPVEATLVLPSRETCSSA
jgi:hypothetical protein